jgi:hypothetical protein
VTYDRIAPPEVSDMAKKKDKQHDEQVHASAAARRHEAEAGPPTKMKRRSTSRR